MTDHPLYRDLRTVFLDSWSDANGWASMQRLMASALNTSPPGLARSATASMRLIPTTTHAL